MIVAERIL